MEAIVEISGRQYPVKPGDVIRVDLLDLAEKAEYKSDRVMLTKEGETVTIGTPYVAGVVVQGTVLGHGRDRKVLVGKFKHRKRYHRAVGHRQGFTRLKIDRIDRA